MKNWDIKGRIGILREGLGSKGMDWDMMGRIGLRSEGEDWIGIPVFFSEHFTIALGHIAFECQKQGFLHGLSVAF